MSVEVEYQLPDTVTGADDQVIFIPLGGDGWVAPQSAYSVFLKRSGDASGGVINLECAMDPQYASLVQYLSFKAFDNNVGADQIDCRTALRVTKGAEVAQQTHVYRGNSLDSTTYDDFGFCGVWEPPGLMLSSNTLEGFDLNPRLTVQMENNNLSELVMSARILNFNKRAREEVPLNVLLSALPR